MLIDAGIEPNEAEIEVKMLLEHFCNYSEKDRIIGAEPDEKGLSVVQEKVLERIKTRIPVQYLIGEAYFMGEFFKVSPDVLIPRDETEMLVRKAIELINRLTPTPALPVGEGVSVLDIGTGSGCIACTIAKRTGAYVLGVDISSDALRIALDNVTKLGINNRAVFRKSNLFEKIREEEKFDMIISNPPYIPEDFEFEPEVLHEPKLALIAKENGLEFYRKITEKAPEFLKPQGILMFELGIGEADAVKELMQKEFKNIIIEKDLAGIERIVYGERE